MVSTQISQSPKLSWIANGIYVPRDRDSQSANGTVLAKLWV